MAPRSFNGWRDWAMAHLNYTMGEAEEYAKMRLAGDDFRAVVKQDSLFQNSEREAATGDHSPQDEVRRSPQRQPRPPAPSKDSGRVSGDQATAGDEDRREVSRSRPEYDPRTSDWQGF